MDEGDAARVVSQTATRPGLPPELPPQSQPAATQRRTGPAILVVLGAALGILGSIEASLVLEWLHLGPNAIVPLTAAIVVVVVAMVAIVLNRGKLDVRLVASAFLAGVVAVAVLFGWLRYSAPSGPARVHQLLLRRGSAVSRYPVGEEIILSSLDVQGWANLAGSAVVVSGERTERYTCEWSAQEWVGNSSRGLASPPQAPASDCSFSFAPRFANGVTQVVLSLAVHDESPFLPKDDVTQRFVIKIQ